MSVFILSLIRRLPNQLLVKIARSKSNELSGLTSISVPTQQSNSEMKMRIKRDSPCLVLRFMPMGKFCQFLRAKRKQKQSSFLDFIRLYWIQFIWQFIHFLVQKWQHTHAHHFGFEIKTHTSKLCRAKSDVITHCRQYVIHRYVAIRGR